MPEIEESDPNCSEFFGNVNRSIAENATPGASGSLIFNACFDSGNLAKAVSISLEEYDLYIRDDTSNERQRVWFYFTVENCISEQRVVFNVINFSKIRLLYKRGLSPVVKSRSMPEWRRMPKHFVKYKRSARHCGSHVMTFKFTFQNSNDLYHFAFCYPFTYSDLNDYLMTIQNQSFIHFCRTCIGYSLKQKRVDLLTITDSSNCANFKNVKSICLTGRVHPGETPSSYICQGFLDFIVSEDPMAVHLRKKYVFQVIPMLNPDGVDLGNYRSSFLGSDLNRQWLDPSTTNHPTIFAAKRAFAKLAENSGEIELFIDIHSHCQLLNTFFYANYLADESSNKRQMILPALLSKIADDYSLNQTRFSSEPAKQGTARRAMNDIFGSHSLCYTLEVSVLGYEMKTKNKSVIFYDQQSYKRIGKNLALSFYRYSMLDKVDTEKLLDGYDLMPEDIQHKELVNQNSKTYTLRQKVEITDDRKEPDPAPVPDNA